VWRVFIFRAEASMTRKVRSGECGVERGGDENKQPKRRVK